jgi:hypothetical protein
VKIVSNKKIIVRITLIALTLVLIVGGCAWYVSDYYRADIGAIEAFAAGDNVSRTVISDKMIAYGEADAAVGFIFYPGGKVEYTAYEPLMRRLASRGVLCILIEMPCNLAVLDMNAADGVQAQYPDVERWYIGGHSLGGSMAASYLAKHTEDFDGIVLLGAYSTADLSTTSLEALSLFGSEDKVMNRGKYDKYKKNLPSGLTELEIEGGCHAYFGMYGAQDGDGTPTISAQEQIYKTADCIWEFVSKGEK